MQLLAHKMKGFKETRRREGEGGKLGVAQAKVHRSDEKALENRRALTARTCRCGGIEWERCGGGGGGTWVGAGHSGGVLLLHADEQSGKLIDGFAAPCRHCAQEERLVEPQAKLLEPAEGLLGRTLVVLLMLLVLMVLLLMLVVVLLLVVVVFGLGRGCVQRCRFLCAVCDTSGDGGRRRRKGFASFHIQRLCLAALGGKGR